MAHDKDTVKFEEDKLWLLVLCAAGLAVFVIYGLIRFNDFSKKKGGNDSSIAEDTQRAAVALERIADALESPGEDAWERKHLPRSVYCRGVK